MRLRVRTQRRWMRDYYEIVVTPRRDPTADPGSLFGWSDLVALAIGPAPDEGKAS